MGNCHLSFVIGYSPRPRVPASPSFSLKRSLSEQPLGICHTQPISKDLSLVWNHSAIRQLISKAVDKSW
ncbi:MAG: hypothetical protein KME21_10545 [Desmonostoc vinosum HA7617-LM4]|nr:hypothetical protein [Desmonostoc vinosum HA7617-LM4]